MIYITSDFSELEAEFDRLENAPSVADRLALNGVLAKGLAMTILAIHVDTGRLKRTPKKSSSYHGGTKTWEGEITVGQHAHQAVDYAYYEKRRGGHHDYIDVLRALHPMWVAVIKGALTP